MPQLSPLDLRPLDRLATAAARPQAPASSATVTGTITPGGSPVTVAISNPGDTARLTFSATAGQRVSVLATNASFVGAQFGCCAATLRINDSSDKTLQQYNGATWVWLDATQQSFLDQVPLPATGTYSLVLQAQSGVTGSVTLTMYDVPADPAPVVVPSAAGATLSLSTTTPGQNMSPTFTGRAGQRISVWVRSSAFVNWEFGCCAATVRVLRASDRLLVQRWTYVDATQGGFLDTVTLPSDGIYVLFVDPDRITTGSVTLTVFDVPPDPAPVLAPSATGDTVSLSTTVPGQNMSPTFAGRAGERVSVWVRSSSFASAPLACCAATVRILKAADLSQVGGWAWVGSTGGGFLDAVTLPADGTYVVFLDPSTTLIGGATLTVFDVPADVTGGLFVAAPWRPTTATPGQNALATFVATGGDVVTLTMSNVAVTGSGSDSCCAARVQLLQGGTQLAAASVGASGASLTKTLAGSGTSVYTVVVDPQGPATGSLTVSLAGATNPLAPPGQTFGWGVCLTGQGVDALSATGCLVDPVNTLTGAFTTSETDLSLASVGVPFSFVRGYTSADAIQGRLGPGWTDSYSLWLAPQPNGDVIVHGEDGQQTVYTKQASGSFVGAPGARSTLTAVTGGYLLVRHDQVACRFDASGVLQSMRDRNGQGLSLGYAASGLLTTITDAVGQVVSLTYGPSSLLARISTPDGRTVTFGYTNGRLTSVTRPDPDGAGPQPAPVLRYAYDASGRLASEIDANGHTVFANVYDDATGRVVQQTDASGKTTSFAWDPAAQTMSVTDPDGHVWKDVYANGVLVQRISGGGDVTQLAHDSDLNVSSVTSPNGSDTTALGYSNGNLVVATAPASLGGAQKRFTYDAQNDVTSVRDARDNLTEYGYDVNGNLTSVKLNGRQLYAATYDARGKRVTSTDANGKQTRYSYDANGNLAAVADPLGDTTTYTYNLLGQVLTKVSPLGNCSGCDPLGHTSTYAYDAEGRLLSETDSLAHSTTYTYDSAGNRLTATDANGHTTTYDYDSANRLVRVTLPDPDGGGPSSAPVTTYTYDASGNRATMVDPRENDPTCNCPGKYTTAYTYDANNRLSSITTPKGEKTTYTYDADGNLATVVDPRGNVSGCGCASQYTTTYGYDAAGRLLTSTDPLGHLTTNHYDAVGNLDWRRDANGHQTSFAHDEQGRVLTVTAPDGGVTAYTYDGNGNLLTRTDDNQHTTTYTYDDVGHLKTITGRGTSPPVTQFGYDADGNQQTKLSPNGGTTTYTYDRADRLVGTTYSDGTPGVGYVLDAVGNRTSMSDGSGTVSYVYDNDNRLSSVTRGSDTFSYSYDAASNVGTRRYPDGTLISYSFDEDNRLSSVASGGQTTSYGYDPAGHLTRTVFPSGNGYIETRTYDRAGRLTELKTANASSTLGDYVVALDPVGNPTQIVRSGNTTLTTAYTYDANDRLSSVCYQATCAAGSSKLTSWTYDKVGNRLTETTGTTTTAYTYNPLDELTSDGTATYSYDANGNLTAGGGKTYTYDLANRLKTWASGATSYSYNYDGDGNRLKTTKGTNKTDFLWDTNQSLPQLALERDGSGNLLRRYVYGARLVSASTPTATLYYHSDNLGSIGNITSSTGAGEWTYTYKPFGAIKTTIKNDTSAPANFTNFTGQYLDPTGLYYLRARQYDASTGRFLQIDPVEPETRTPYSSSYAYTANRPTVMVDPSGALFAPSDAGTSASRLATSTNSFFCLMRGCGWALGYANYYPFDRQLVIGRVDAGVDTAIRHVGPIFAIGASRVTKIDTPGPGGAWGGLGAMYLDLDEPITINGRRYTKWYTAEAGYYEPNIHVGSRVYAGERVAFTQSGWQETGFNAGQPLSGDAKSQEGYDFRDFCLLMRQLGLFAPGA